MNATTTPIAGDTPQGAGGRVMLFGAIILVCGMILGCGLTMLVLRLGAPPRPFHKGPPAITEIADRMGEDLRLTEGQKQQLVQIIEERMKEFKPIMEAEFVKTKELINTILTDEQKKRLEEITNTHREGGPGFPGMPPPPQ